ncbi:hypothetical protein TNCV_2514581 [Trichonephila clavipes]|nr:hypothetical protein TNCV_2514581 [Trichonephila clavipes]
MDGTQMYTVLSQEKTTSPYFQGVYSRDTLPPLQENMRAIVNSDDSSQPGTHWLALFVNDKRKLEFYTSFGQPPVFYNISTTTYLDVLWNSKVFQSPTSNGNSTEEKNSTRQHERNSSTHRRKQLNSAAGTKQLNSASLAPPLQQNRLFLSTHVISRLEPQILDYAEGRAPQFEKHWDNRRLDGRRRGSQSDPRFHNQGGRQGGSRNGAFRGQNDQNRYLNF